MIELVTLAGYLTHSWTAPPSCEQGSNDLDLGVEHSTVQSIRTRMFSKTASLEETETQIPQKQLLKKWWTNYKNNLCFYFINFCKWKSLKPLLTSYSAWRKDHCLCLSRVALITDPKGDPTWGPVVLWIPQKHRHSLRDKISIYIHYSITIDYITRCFTFVFMLLSAFCYCPLTWKTNLIKIVKDLKVRPETDATGSKHLGNPSRHCTGSDFLDRAT